MKKTKLPFLKEAPEHYHPTMGLKWFITGYIVPGFDGSVKLPGAPVLCRKWFSRHAGKPDVWVVIPTEFYETD